MKTIILSIAIMLSAMQVSCAQDTKTNQKNPKVTFIELGSVRCIPCQKMEAVLDKVRKKYPNDVKVIFYDVWTKEGRPYAEQYGIQMIPTQVFLDTNGKEFYRHVGYFPEEEVIKILKQKNVKK